MEQLAYMEVDDPEVFEALNSTLRTRILRRMGEPKSIREVAEELNMPPTRLYYHVNLMEDVGIIEVVETRKVGAMLQKIYQAKAKGFRPSPKLTDSDLEPQELAKIMSGVVLDGARVDAIEALMMNFGHMKAGEPDAKVPGSIGRTLGFFSREQAERFSKKLQELIEEEFDQEEDRTDGDEYSLTYVFFPIAGSAQGDGE